jgi:hypothetical protein
VLLKIVSLLMRWLFSLAVLVVRGGTVALRHPSQGQGMIT